MTWLDCALDTCIAGVALGLVMLTYLYAMYRAAQRVAP